MAAVPLPTHYRNVFAELGYAQAEIDARIENVQMMENGNRTTDSTKAPPAPKAQCFPVQGGCYGSVQPVSQNHQSSIVILVMTGICLGLFQVSGP